MMRRRLLLVALACGVAFAAKLPETIDGRRMLEDVKWLSSERYQGRMTGTPELDAAARWIAKNFERAGLKPPFAEGGAKPGYLQKFTVNTDAKLGKKNTLRVGDKEVAVARDFVPRVFSGNGEVKAGLVFAGYGITANEYHYDDYRGIDVKGKIVVILRTEPQDQDEKAVFDGKRSTRHSSLETKAINAKVHGAAGVILINNYVTYPQDADKLDGFGGHSGGMGVGIPVVQVKATIAEKWFEAAGKDLKATVKKIDDTLDAQSFALPDTMTVTLRVDVDRVLRPTFNVAGYLPGSTDEYIVVGAHYDHLGMGRQFSMAPSEVPKIHPGADDNASGTAAVIELARYFARQPKMKRGVLFVAFSGEEIGLLGSSHLVGNMPLAIEKCAGMINMDMVGRMTDGRFYVAGVGTGTTFKVAVDEVMKLVPDLKPELSDNLNIGGSDHTSFSARQVPALFFFSGLHNDYHKPSDTWDKIDPGPYGALVRVVAATTAELASTGERAQYVRVAPAAMPSGGGGGGYGPYFGSVPDFAPVSGGVKFSDVRPGSPAEKAGIRGGDIMIEFDGKAVGSLEEYTYLLRSKAVGDTVAVKVKRGSEVLNFKVLLEARK